MSQLSKQFMAFAAPVGTPISRRLRSRAAPSLEDTIKSTVSNCSQQHTTTDFDSDSDDFVVKKAKAKPKITKTGTKAASKKGPPKSKPEKHVKFSNSDSKRTSLESIDSSLNVADKEDKVSKAGMATKPKKDPGMENKPLKEENDTERVSPNKEIKSKEKQLFAQNSEQNVTHEVKKEPLGKLTDLVDDMKFPDIVQEFYTGNVNFLTKNAAHQQLELKERKKLLEIRKVMDEYIRKFRIDSMMKALEISSAFGNVRLCDILEQMGNPTSFEKFANDLENVEITPNMIKGKLPIISEDCEEGSDLNVDADDEQHSPPEAKIAKYSFPRPKQQVVSTPAPGLHRLPVSVFTFGADAAANKIARLPKPGEIYYSDKGSPIVPQGLNKDLVSSDQLKAPHTIEVVDLDGEKIKVDLVLRSGAPEKAKFFAEFVTDVRGVAATRSTVKHNRILPPRVPIKSRKGVSTAKTVTAASSRKRQY